MQIPFKKYQGTGNDFVIIDNRKTIFNKANLEAIQLICDRKFGIGADGLILIENHEKYDFNMVFFNPDGSQSFCGNGSRCAVQFAHELGIITNTKTMFVSTDGLHEALVLGKSNIKLKMHNVIDITTADDHYFMNTGSPHYVSFQKNINDLDIIQKGREVRYAEAYKTINGTNVNFIEEKTAENLVRTYERGVEDETLSCGTGVTACAISIALKNNLTKGEINIITKGGNLSVSLEKTAENHFTNIWLEGAATFVFEGTISL